MFRVSLSEQTGSTNDAVVRVLGEPDTAGLVLVRPAGEQSGGSSLDFTAILPRSVASVDLWAVTFWAALGVADGIEAVDGGLRVQLRWPNEMLIDGRTCGEIACVSRIEGERAWVGCGVTLDVVAGGADRERMPAAILAAFEARIGLLDDAAAVAREWEKRAALYDTPYHFAIAGESEPIHARALMLAQEGSLVVQSGDRMRVIPLADARLRFEAPPAADEAPVAEEREEEVSEDPSGAISPEEREALDLLERLAELEEGEQR